MTIYLPELWDRFYLFIDESNEEIGIKLVADAPQDAVNAFAEYKQTVRNATPQLLTEE